MNLAADPVSRAEIMHDMITSDLSIDTRISEYVLSLPHNEKEMQRLTVQAVDECVFTLFVSMGVCLPHLAAESIAEYVAKYIEERSVELARSDCGVMDAGFFQPRATFYIDQVEEFILKQSLAMKNDEKREQIFDLANRMMFNEQHVENVGYEAVQFGNEFMPQIFAIAIARPFVAADLLQRLGRIFFYKEAEQVLLLNKGLVPHFDADFNHLAQQVELERLLE